MEERRKEKRTSIAGRIDVVDVQYDENIGTLVDISPKGLRLKGAEPIEAYDQLKLQLGLPDRIFGKKTIDVVAICMWCEPDAEENRWLCGFEFSNVSQEDSSTIIGLILETEKSG